MKIVDYQATPSGYYQIAFRNDKGQTIIVTQHGRGGCNHYASPNGDIKPELDAWLDTHRQGCEGYLRRTGFPELADAVRDKENEWQDTVVMSICDLIDMGKMSVEG